jgi:hypothetical protein
LAQLWEAGLDLHFISALNLVTGTEATVLRVTTQLCMQHEQAFELQRSREESRAQTKKTETDEGDRECAAALITVFPDFTLQNDPCSRFECRYAYMIKTLLKGHALK